MNPILRYLRSLFPIPLLAFVPVRKTLHSLAILPLGLSLLSPQALTPPMEQSPTVVRPEQVKDLLADDTDLPIADIKVMGDTDDVGTVVFFPQYHRYPGSKVEDKRNDPGFKTQQELYSILSQVVTETGVDTVFVEGEFVGAVAEDDRTALTARIDALATFEGQLAQVKGVLGPYMSEEDLSALLAQADASAALARRGIVLEGAPEQLWAEGADIALYGTESPETREASAELVRQHVYLQDQLKRVAKGDSLGASFSGLIELFSDKTRAFLMQRLSGQVGEGVSKQSLMRQLLERQTGRVSAASTSHDSFGQLDDIKQRLPADATDALSFVETFKGSWEALMREPAPSVQTRTTATPSRSANPYAQITSQSEIKQLLEENNRQIEAVVIEQRNAETAETVARTMDDRDELISVLQFGAGHEEGLVRALREQNLSVVTIVPDAVAEGRLNSK